MADKWGVRKAVIVAFISMFIGRFILVGCSSVFSHSQGLWSPFFWVSIIGIMGIIIGYGFFQPAIYSGVRQFCDERSSAMGYAMLYAVMNLGGFLPGIISPPIRKIYGIPGVYWLYVGLTLINLLLFSSILTRKTQEDAIESVKRYEREHSKNIFPVTTINSDTKKKPENHNKSNGDPFWTWLRNHPLADPKFSLFIFILIPVQTLFAHNWLTLPQYVDRALGSVGHNYMEFFVNLNPILIFLLTPMVAAATRKANVYKMMIIGTLVMAAPTFLLSIAPSIWFLLGYLIIMSIGEAMWQPRFLQYAAEIAPPGRTGAYMGVAQFPWFLTKVITSLYAGWFLMRFCPETGPQNTTMMWLIYGFIAMISPIALFLLRGWLGKDFKTKADQP